MRFIDTVYHDIELFFDDLAEEVYLDGNKTRILIDYDRLKDRSKKEYDGIVVGDLLYFCKAEDLPNIPKVGDKQILGKKMYEIFDVRKDLGIFEIILKGASS